MRSISTLSTEEALGEAVHRLEQALTAERRLRDEAEALLAGLRALATASSLVATDAALLACLQPVLGWHAAALLVQADDGELHAQPCTDPALAGLRLRPGPVLRRVLAGQPAAIFDLAQVPELAALAQRPEHRSALCVGLVSAGRTALVIGVHPQTAAFSPRQTALARSFAQAAAPVLTSLATREEAQQRRLAEARADALERNNAALQAQLDTIVRQQAQIQRLSAPVLRIWRGVVAVPIVGLLDEDQVAHLSERLLQALCDFRARVAILELTGLDAVDATTGERLRMVIGAAKLIGARCFVTGVRPDLAATLAEHGLRGLRSFASLADGLAAAIEAIGPRAPDRPSV